MRTCRTAGWVCLLVAVIWLTAVGVVSAKTIEVYPGKSSSIGSALESAVAGDVVLVGFGTYQEYLLMIPDGVSLAGVGASRESVVIESSAPWPLIQVTDAGSGVDVSNMTFVVSEFAAPYDHARGQAALIDNSLANFTNVAFKGFEAGYGGAVYVKDGSEAIFDGCLFEDNTALATGGAISVVDNSAVSLIGCLMVNNTAASWGVIST